MPAERTTVRSKVETYPWTRLLPERVLEMELGTVNRQNEYIANRIVNFCDSVDEMIISMDSENLTDQVVDAAVKQILEWTK